MSSHCFFVFISIAGLRVYHFPLPTFALQSPIERDPKQISSMKNDTSAESICFYGKYFCTVHCPVYCLDSSVSFIRPKIRFGEKIDSGAETRESYHTRQIYPFPFLCLLDFFLGRTISIHFWIFAPNIATLICSWRPYRERVNQIITMWMFLRLAAAGDVVFYVEIN